MAERVNPMKSFGFGMDALRKFPELIPLVVIISTAVIGCSGFCTYALATKPDVRVIKSRGVAHDTVEPGEYRKLYVWNKDWNQDSIPELDSLRREIGSYKG